MKRVQQWIQRRLGGDLVAPLRPPVDALDWFTTFRMSQDRVDEPPAALIDLTLDIAKAALHSVSIADIGRRPYVEEFYLVWPGDNYRWLAAMTYVLKPKVVIEIGTWTGLSALSIKKYLPPDGKLVSFDIQPWKEVEETALTDEDFADGRLEQRLDDLSDPASIERHRALLESADYFFIDGPKDGQMEYRLLENFKLLNFARDPLLVWDDIHLPNMLKLWRELRLPKLDVSTFGHWSGTGLVQWQSRR